MVTCTDCGKKFKTYIEYTKHKCEKGKVPMQDKVFGKYLENCENKDHKLG